MVLYSQMFYEIYFVTLDGNTFSLLVRGIQIQLNTFKQNAGSVCFPRMKMYSNKTFNIELPKSVHSQT